MQIFFFNFKIFAFENLTLWTILSSFWVSHKDRAHYIPYQFHMDHFAHNCSVVICGTDSSLCQIAFVPVTESLDWFSMGLFRAFSSVPFVYFQCLSQCHTLITETL